MKKRYYLIVTILLLMTFHGCGKNEEIQVESKLEYSSELLPIEKDSIQVGSLSPDHEYYETAVKADPDCVNYITEISMYDEEVNDTFVMHVSLPPNYDNAKEYPVVVMTDGIWRLLEHIRFRPLMEEGKIEQLIMVSIGYPDGYSYGTIRRRDFLDDPESYLHFIVDNLMPYLFENYSIGSENNMLLGHSYGGYFTSYALFHKDTIGKDYFHNYFMGSVSVPDSERLENLYEYERQYNKRNDDMDCNVYVTVGSKEDGYLIDLNLSLVDTIDRRKYAGLSLSYEVLQGYAHEETFEPSMDQVLPMFYGIEENQ